MCFWLTALLALFPTWAGAADSIKFSESLRDRVSCTRQNGEPACGKLALGRFSVKVAAFGDMNPGDPAIAALLRPTTVLSISIGDWSWTGTLGDDPKYRTGKKRATIKLRHFGKCLDLGRGSLLCPNLRHGTVRFAVTRRGISVRVTAKTGDPGKVTPMGAVMYESSPLAESLLPIDGSFAASVAVDLDIGLGAFLDSSNVLVAGTGKRKLVRRGGQSFDVDSIKLRSPIRSSSPEIFLPGP